MRSVKKMFLLSRIYSIPILVLLAGFGIYYTIFEAVYEFEEELNSPSIKELTHHRGNSQTTNKKDNELVASIPVIDSTPSINKKEDQGVALETITHNQQKTDHEVKTEVSVPETQVQTPPVQTPIIEEKTPPSVTKEHTNAQAPVYYVVNVSILNVRQSPSTDAVIATRLYHGDKIIALEEKSQWLKIKEGWVNKAFLDKIEGDAPVYEVALGVINVRQDPSINSPIVGKKTKGAVIVPLEERLGWIKTSEGWVYKPLLKERKVMENS